MPVPAEYKFRIDVPYVITDEDQSDIYEGKAGSKKWKDAYKLFKGNIREHLRKKQKARCAFCRLRINESNSYSNLEHIVGKTAYPQFEFLPRNLVNACIKCNFSKSIQSTIRNPVANKAMQVYPLTSNEFKIVNPYLDDFETHLDFIDNLIITPVNNSEKGINTIKYYKLTRPKLAEDRAAEFRIDTGELMETCVLRLNEAKDSKLILDQLREMIA